MKYKTRIQNTELNIKPSTAILEYWEYYQKEKNHNSMSNNLATITQWLSGNEPLSASKRKTDFELYLWCEKHLAGIPKEFCIYYFAVSSARLPKLK